MAAQLNNYPKEDSMDRRNRFSQTNHADRTPVFVTIAVVSVLAIGVAIFSPGESETADVTVSQASGTVAPDSGSRGEIADLVVPPRYLATFADGREAYNQRKYGDAVEAFEGYVERNPEKALGHYMLGLSAWKAGDLERARTALERSVEIDSVNVKALLNLGRVLIDQGRSAEAEPRIRAAVALDAGSAEVHRMLARVQGAIGQQDSAEASYRVALSIDPRDSWSMNNLGTLLIQQGRYEEALMPLARAVTLRPESPVFANNFGLALERTGHPGSATEAYRSALAVDSTYAKAARSLARVEGRVDDKPIDIAQLAAKFDDSLQSALRMRVAAKGVGKPEG
jgi:Tfp pilus assembly protein PilF